MKKAIITAILAITAYTAVFRTECEKGLCLNEQGDGMIYNADPNYNYISYRSTNAQTGDKVFTVLVLNPLNTAPDDYIYRRDWILGKE